MCHKSFINKHEKMRDEIVRIASKIFSIHGYDKTSIKDIAKHLKRKQSSVYYYFKSKEEIFRSVVEEEFNQLIEELKKVISETIDQQQKLRLYLTTRMKKIKSVSNFYNMLKDEYFSGIPFVEELRYNFDRQEFQIIKEILNEGKQRNVFEVSNTENLAIAIIAAMRGLEIPFFYKHIEIEIDKQLDQLLNLLFYGLLKRG